MFRRCRMKSKLLRVDRRNGERNLFEHVEQHLHRFERSEERHVVLDRRAADFVAVEARIVLIQVDRVDV